MAISYQRVASSSGTSVTVDVGAAGNDRLLVCYMCDESEPGASFQGTVSVDGKSFTQQVVVETTDGPGQHHELHTIDESGLGSTNGSQTVSYSGGDSGWTIIVEVWYGVANDTMYDSGSNTGVGSSTITVSNIDCPAGGLASMGAGHGETSASATGWTSPLTERADLNGSGHSGASASGVESSAQTNKSYTCTWCIRS